MPPLQVAFPFSWLGIGDVGVKKISDLQIVRARLQDAFSFKLSDCAFYPTTCPIWINKLYSTAREHHRTMPELILEEELESSRHQQLIDWLLLDEQKKWNQDLYGTLRKGRAYSYSAEKIKELEYVHPSEIAASVRILRDALENHRHVDPVLLAISAFGHFISIHPFPDGNGRAARRLLSAILRKHRLLLANDLPLSFLIYRDRRRFIENSRLLLVERKWSGFVTYMLDLVGAAVELYVLNELVRNLPAMHDSERSKVR